jgi:hypothetical protein
MTIDDILKEFDEKNKEYYFNSRRYDGCIEDIDIGKIKEFLKQSIESYAKEIVMEELENIGFVIANNFDNKLIFRKIKERIAELKGDRDEMTVDDILKEFVDRYEFLIRKEKDKQKIIESWKNFLSLKLKEYAASELEKLLNKQYHFPPCKKNDIEWYVASEDIKDTIKTLKGEMK